MENFDIPGKKRPTQTDQPVGEKRQQAEKAGDSGALTMSVSPICPKEGKKVAYVTFSDGIREAEGEIPTCRIIRNKGFAQDEIVQLEEYLQRELENLKKMASKLNVFDAFLGR